MVTSGGTAPTLAAKGGDRYDSRRVRGPRRRHGEAEHPGGLVVDDQLELVAPLLELSLFFLRENHVPVILISFRNRFLPLAPAITGG